MNSEDKQTIINRYENRLTRFGDDIRTLASGTKERQTTRFQVLQELGIVSGSSVLDLGCGLGDFYAFLSNCINGVDYTGYDISPKLIDVARHKFPDATFNVRDIQEDTSRKTFDYIVCSQVFNNILSYENNLEVAKEVISICYSKMNKGLAFDFLSDDVDYRDEGLCYYSANEVFSFCKSLSKRVCLRHDYPLFEFAVYVYPDFQGWSHSD